MGGYRRGARATEGEGWYGTSRPGRIRLDARAASENRPINRGFRHPLTVRQLACFRFILMGYNEARILTFVLPSGLENHSFSSVA